MEESYVARLRPKQKLPNHSLKTESAEQTKQTEQPAKEKEPQQKGKGKTEAKPKLVSTIQEQLQKPKLVSILPTESKKRKKKLNRIHHEEKQKSVQFRIRKRLEQLDPFLQYLGLLDPIPATSQCGGCYLGDDDLELFLTKWCRDCEAEGHTHLSKAKILVDLTKKPNQKKQNQKEKQKEKEKHPVFIGEWRKAKDDEDKSDFFPNPDLLRKDLIQQLNLATASGVPRTLVCQCVFHKKTLSHQVAVFFYIDPQQKKVSLQEYNPSLEFPNSQTGHEALFAMLLTWLPEQFPEWEWTEEMSSQEGHLQQLQEEEEEETKNKKEVKTKTGKRLYEPDGFCQTWSALVILLSIAFPDSTLKKIADYIYQQYRGNLTSFIQTISYNLNNKSTNTCCKNDRGAWLT